MNIKKVLPYATAVIVFTIVSLAYFSPVLEGKQIKQSDITQFIGSSKEIVDFRKQHGEEPYWTNTSFGGMPSYAVSTYYPNDYIKKIDKVLRFLPRPADYLFLYFFGFFILLTVLKVDWKLAIFGSLGFGLSTYLIIILGVGHNAKAHAIAYMPLVLSGIILVFQRKYLLGFIVTALAMSLELMASHIQMTYYLMFVVLIFGIVQIIDAVKKNELNIFAKNIGILAAAVILAIGTNATSLLATKEYAKHSTRSQSELTITPDGSEKEITSGLSPDYITEYSYGISETFNLFIPRFKGGTRHEEVEDSELLSFLQGAMTKGLSGEDANYLMQVSSMYWGNQPIVAAPAYIGSIFIFLFVLSLFVVKGKYKYWLLAATVFSILMSWGKNNPLLTDFFINYVPLYNKFRAVSSIQVIAELCIPLLAVLGLKELIFGDSKKEDLLKTLKNTMLIVGGLALFFVALGTSLFDFVTPMDEQIDEQISGYLDAIVADRQALLFNDSLRSLIFVTITAAILWAFLKDKLKEYLVIICLIVLVLVDLVNIDKRYVNDDYFTTKRKVSRPFKASKTDTEILRDKGIYRVANFNRNLFADGGTSYFHKSIGGYHAAKLGRYQELYDFHISKSNLQVLNMLNTKYIIGTNDKGEEIIDVNEDANGNAWFVQNVKFIGSADEEIRALDNLDTKTEVTVHGVYSSQIKNRYVLDSTAVIRLTKYQANELRYESLSKNDQFSVFSEVYYKDGWNAYIDGVLTDHMQVNYVLRGMEIPAGNHKIEFKFEPTVIQKGNTITLISYALLVLIPIGWFAIEKKKKKHESPQ
jgi:hypothetical protein